MTETKVCSTCKQEKNKTEFHKRSGRACGVISACKTCREKVSRIYYENNTEEIIDKACKYQKDNAQKTTTDHRAWRVANRQKTKAYSLKNKYNLSLEVYESMILSQNGVCLICGNGPSHGKPLVVDHNHETGEVRGLLCTYCNLGLGMFKDSKELLTAALEYLWR